MSISVVPTEAELRRILAQVTEVAWMIRALNVPRSNGNSDALLNLVESWPDHQLQSLAAMLIDSEQFETREAALAAIRDLVERRARLFIELLQKASEVP